MSKLKFSDGEVFDTSGELRIEKRSDGLYVMGEGYLIPVENGTEANKILNTLSGKNIESHRNQLAFQILYSCVRSNFINYDEANEGSIREAAECVAINHEEDEEIGSSDMTFIKKEFLEEIGKETAWENNRLIIKY